MEDNVKQPLMIGAIAASSSFLLFVVCYYIFSIVTASTATFAGIFIGIVVGIVVGAIAGGIAFAVMRNR